jgi:hypothetical protein
MEDAMKSFCGVNQSVRLFSFACTVGLLAVVVVLAASAGYAQVAPPRLLPYIETIAAGSSNSACSLVTYPSSVTTVGVPVHAYCHGDGWPATSSSVTFNAAYATVVDSMGNLFFAAVDGTVRRVDAVTGTVSTYVGGVQTGSIGTTCPWSSDPNGDGCPGNETYMKGARGIAIAPVSVLTCSGTDGHGAGCPSPTIPIHAGDMIVSDSSGSRVRLVSASNYLISTVVWNACNSCAAPYTTGTIGDNGTATIHHPYGAAFNQFGQLAIADNSNNRVVLIDFSTGQETNVVGPCSSGCATPAVTNSTATAGDVNPNSASDVSFDAQGNLYVGVNNDGQIWEAAADSTGHVSSNSLVSVIVNAAANTGCCGVSGPASSLQGAFRSVRALPNGDLFFGDEYHSSTSQTGNLFYYDHNNQYATKILGNGSGNGKASCIIGGSSVASPYSGCPGAVIHMTAGVTGGISMDPWGNVYVPDSRDGGGTGQYVRKVSLGTNYQASPSPNDLFGTSLIHFEPASVGWGGYVNSADGEFQVAEAHNGCSDLSGYSGVEDCEFFVSYTGSGADTQQFGITDEESSPQTWDFPVTYQSMPVCGNNSNPTASSVTAANTGSSVNVVLSGANTGVGCSGNELMPSVRILTFALDNPPLYGSIIGLPATAYWYPGSTVPGPTVTYVPFSDFDGSGSNYVGADSFTYTVADNSVFANATVYYDTACIGSTVPGCTQASSIVIPQHVTPGPNTTPLTVSPASSVSLLSSSVNTTTAVTNLPASPVSYPNSYTITATVAPYTGSTWPQGTVTFTVNGTQQGSPVSTTQSGSDGVATLTLPQAPATYTIVAAYAPASGSGFAASSGSDTVVINPVTVTPSVTAQSKTYDTTTNATVSCTLSGVVDGDNVGCMAGAANFASAGVGSGITVTATGITLTGSAAGNYVLSSTTATTIANISQAQVTAGVTAQNKTYDTTKAATITSCNLTGVYSGDSGNVSCSVVGPNTFASANAGTSITVTATVGLSGSAAPNYVLASTTPTTTANITQAQVTATVTAANKTYDTTATATITSCTLSGVLGSDSVTCSVQSASFPSPAAGTGLTVTANVSLTGSAALNYVLASTTPTTSANITQAQVTASVTAQNKTYDTTTAATITSCNLTGVYSGDSANVGCSVVGPNTFASANAGTSITVTATVSLSGSAAPNYVLASTTPTTTANIAQATVTASVTANNKAYNGTTAATIATCTLAGVLGSDNVTCSAAAASFASMYPANGITVTATGISLGGTAAGNYVLSSTTATTSANITQATVTAVVTAANKYYDGTTNATITNCALSGVIGSDNVVCTATGSNTFSTAMPGTNLTVTARGIVLSGAQVAYYTLASTAATTQASILAVNLPPKAIPYMTSLQAGGVSAQYTVGATCPSGNIATDVWGDGCLATEAYLDKSVDDQVVDQNGNIYLVSRDVANNSSAIVQEINATTGIISVFAGGASSGSNCNNPDPNVNGSGNTSGDGCPASNASFKQIRGLAIDANYLYVADEGSSKIHRVTLANGPVLGRTYAHEMDLVAGTATSGWNGDGPQATTEIKNPYGVAVDKYGNVFWADGGTSFSAVRMVNYAQNPPQVHTVVNYTSSTTTGATGACEISPNLTVTPANTATTNSPYGLTFDVNGNLYFGDKECYSLRKVTPNSQGVVDGTGTSTFSTLIGNGTQGSSSTAWYDTAAAPTAFNYKIQSVTTASLNPTTWTSNTSNLYIAADTSLWMYDAATGWVHEIMNGGSAGCTGHTTTPYTGCPAPHATFSGSSGGSHMAVDAYGNLYLADYGNGQVTKLAIGTDFEGFGPEVFVTPNSSVTHSTLIHGSGVCSGGSATVLSTAAPYSIGNPATTCSAYGSGTDLQNDWVVSTAFTPPTGGPLPGSLSVGSTNVSLDGYGNNPVVVTCSNASKTYGNADPAFNSSSSPAVGSWTVAPVCVVAPESGVGSSPYAITVSNCSSLAASGYGPFTCNPGQLTVNPRTVTPAITASSKTYDTTTAASVTCSLSNVLDGDNVTCAASAANFASPGAGSAIGVTATGITLSGSAAVNYALSSTTANTTATINPASVTASVTAGNKTYDTTTAATITSCSLAGVLGSDSVTCAAAGPNTFASAGVGTSITVTATNIGLSGGAAANYVLASTTATTSANINPAQVSATVTAANKTYDSTTNEPLAGIGCNPNVLAADQSNVTCAGTAASFASANAGTGITVTVSGISLSGSAAGNYTLSSTTATTNANINPAQVSATVTAANKTYDSTTNEPLAGVSCNPNVLAVDQNNVTCAGTAASFASAGVGTGITVTVTGIGLSGSAAGNYTLSSTTATTNANITPAQVSAGITAQNKTYDATTAATISSCSLTGVYSGDSGNVTCAAAGPNTFASAGVGTGITVTATNIALSGSAAGNYVLASTTATTNANINPAQVTATVTAANKTYDSTTNEPLAGIGCNPNVLAADQSNVTCAGTVASFASAGVGTGITVTVTGIGLSGSAAGNYTLSSTTATNTANITPAQVSATVTAANKTYDTTTNEPLAGIGCNPNVLAVDQNNVTCAGTAAVFASAGVGTGITVTVTGIGLSGSAAGNYALSSTTATTSANINQAQVTAGVGAQNKTYDATTAATINSCSLTGVYSGDSGNVSCAAAGPNTFASAGVGTGIAVTATNIALSGGAAANYVLASATAGTSANITQAQVTATVTAANKSYDSTTNEPLAGISCNPHVLAADQNNVTCAGTGASFASANVGNGITVTVTGISLSGGAAANYALTSTTATTSANINQAQVTASVTAQNKPYDGTTNATISSCNLSGVVSSESPNVTCSIVGPNNFASPNTGTGIRVTATVALTGSAAAHYVLASTTPTTTANISTAAMPLTVTAQNATRPAGTANPAFSWTITGFVGSDTAAVVSGAPLLTTTANTSSPAGSYPISASQGTLQTLYNNYNFTFVSGTLIVTRAYTLTYLPPAIPNGTALGWAQLTWALSAVDTITGAQVQGTAVFYPPASYSSTPLSYGEMLPAGNYIITVNFTPNSSSYASQTTTGLLSITQYVPQLSWSPNAASLAYGAPLAASYLDAKATHNNQKVPGTFDYYADDAAHTQIAVGYTGLHARPQAHIITAVFHPNDLTTYADGSSISVPIDVVQAPVDITYAPSLTSMPYHSLLVSGQLDGATTVTDRFHVPITGGAWTFTCPSPCPTGNLSVGQELPGGAQEITAVYTPPLNSESTGSYSYSDYLPKQLTKKITVTAAPVVVVYTIASSLTYPSPLVPSQLEAVAETPVLDGNNLPTGRFTPIQGPGGIDDDPGGAIVYTSKNTLSSGTVVVTDGTVLVPGSDAITATYVPGNSSNYKAKQSTAAAITVQKTPSIMAPLTTTSTSLTYGQPLSTTGLTVSVTDNNGVPISGKIVYTTQTGAKVTMTTVLPASATPYTITATFTPTEPKFYTTAQGSSAPITVSKDTPQINLTASFNDLKTGVKLSVVCGSPTATDVNGKAVPGTFKYTDNGSLVLVAPSSYSLTSGLHTIGITFYPNDTSDYQSPSTGLGPFCVDDGGGCGQ